MSAHTNRWEIWGRHQVSENVWEKETLLEKLELHEDRDVKLADARDEYGPHWHLWLIEFPIKPPCDKYRRHTQALIGNANKATIKSLRCTPEESARLNKQLYA